MKRIAPYLLLIAALSITIASCQKEKDPQDSGTTETEQVANLFNMQDAALLTYEQSLRAHKDSVRALLDMGKWLQRQGEVETVTLVAPHRLTVQYENGIKSSITVISETTNGQQHVRQGGKGKLKGSVTKYTLGKSSKKLGSKVIASDKVLILCPFYNEFYSGSYPYLDLFEDSTVPLEVTLVTDDKCTIDLLDTFHEYGLIILNTHGQYDGSFQLHAGTAKFALPENPNSSTKAWTTQHIEEFLNTSANDMLHKIKNGYYTLEFSALINSSGQIRRSVSLGVTGLAVKGLSKKLKDAVVFGNYCFSGQREEGTEVVTLTARDMPGAWQAAGAAAYYGYAFGDGKAAVVDNSFAKAMEQRIITRLVKDGDSTGIAHLDANLNEYSFLQERVYRKLVTQVVTEELSVETVKTSWEREKVMENFYCKLFMSPAYSYGCGEFTDPRDGEKYKLACIGNQIWFAENLRYAKGGIGKDYDNNPAHRALYGRLYTHREVMNGQTSSTNPSAVQGLCPEGWHVPSKAEWDELIAFVGEEPETKLRSKDGWDEPGTDEFGFNMRAAGFMSSDISIGIGSSGWLWTPTQGAKWGDDGLTGYHSVHIRSTSIKYSGFGNPAYGGDQDFVRHSCRCAKD